ncbi:MAG: butyrate kinase [Bacillota bacterium]|nr:butyrate kinase [Bacillota bacterium]MDD3297703.1 butyrate kinase [Bacillota bacterium]MDD3850402.1 butyrate kinase [Bacillota bacterium]MDD4706597.1 butyrate kinase [Bacillota bacterium]
MKADGYVLAINPGSTSTKVALFKDNKNVRQRNLSHSVEVLDKLGKVAGQYEYRLGIILGWLKEEGIELKSLDAVAGRGGLLAPIPGGTYIVTSKMLDDLETAARGEHASNLGAMLAKGIADRAGVSAFIADPVSVDEFEDIARISGIPELPRRTHGHVLNIKAVAHRVAMEEGKPLDGLRLIMVHLGGGISIAPLKDGKIIDVNGANDYGPFSPERAGGVPTGALIKMAYSGKHTKQELKQKFIGKAGLAGYLGTNDAREVERMIEQGDQRAEFILKAMAYQIAKEIGAMSTVLKGKVDYIILTGGLAHSKKLVDAITKMTAFIAPAKVLPGEDEMRALAEGVYRVLSGEQQAKVYEEEVKEID